MVATKTKASFTLDQGLYQRAEKLSRTLRLSRSEFYSRAIEDLVIALEERELKDRINEAQASLSDEARAEGEDVTVFLREATARTQQRAHRQDTW